MSNRSYDPWTRNISIGRNYATTNVAELLNRSILEKFTGFLNSPKSIAEYARLEGTHNGKLLNVDIARQLCPEFRASVEGANRYSGLTHKLASQWIKKRFQERLERDPTGSVVLLAGGGGSGKSTIARQALSRAISEAELVVDGVMAEYDSTARRIEDILFTERRLLYVYVFVPFPEAVRRVVSRSAEIGRIVEKDVLATAHAGAQATFFRVWKEYVNHRLIKLCAYDNSGEKPREMSIAEVAAVRYAQHDEDIGATAERLLASL